MLLARKRIVLPLLVVIYIYLAITTPVQEYADELGYAYNKWALSSEGRWRMWRATRWYIGRFRSPPNDEEMIEYFNENRAEFEALAASYYEAMKPKGSEKLRSEILIHERMRLGIDSFGISGPALCDANSGSFYNFGVSLSLIDSGPTPWWSLGQRTYKQYHYVPDAPPLEKRKMTPLKNMLATGEYAVAESADVQLSNERRSPCALWQIDRNWFISRCTEHWD